MATDFQNNYKFKTVSKEGNLKNKLEQEYWNIVNNKVCNSHII